MNLRASRGGCWVCKGLSRTVGRLLYFFLGKKWGRLEAAQVHPHLRGLGLELVGGLATRGWTLHDVDVVGARADVPRLVARLRAAGVRHPVHYCGGSKHSHLDCIRGGLAVLVRGDMAHPPS